jgi:hypothetical protein
VALVRRAIRDVGAWHAYGDASSALDLSNDMRCVDLSVEREMRNSLRAIRASRKVEALSSKGGVMSDVKVQVLKDGPLLVAGKVALTGVDGKQIDMQQDPIALCRCGHSTKKPFCDGSHKKANFKG